MSDKSMIFVICHALFMLQFFSRTLIKLCFFFKKIEVNIKGLFGRVYKNSTK